jgi:hypothetical protein
MPARQRRARGGRKPTAGRAKNAPRAYSAASAPARGRGEALDAFISAAMASGARPRKTHGGIRVEPLPCRIRFASAPKSLCGSKVLRALAASVAVSAQSLSSAYGTRNNSVAASVSSVSGRTADGVTSRADEYRQLARDCLKLANMVPSGPPRDTLIDMAREWGRLADEQDRATDLRTETWRYWQR